MATHSNILDWRVPMDRGAWGHKELDTTEWKHSRARSEVIFCAALVEGKSQLADDCFMVLSSSCGHTVVDSFNQYLKFLL